MSEHSGPKSESPPAIKELSGKIGKYDIVKPLGKGAMGMVYLAHDTVLERDVALKVMVSQIADDPELKQRFEREAKAVAKMTHPNVVTVFDLGYHTDGSPYIAMELLKGQDLQKAVRQPPPMPLDRKVSIIVQVLAGLAHAHQAGIVHRDIKPANIFINADGTVKIMDFGVARLTTASMTGTGNIVGTADYMSPEQVKGAKVDGRSDVFSVGCMLYELLAGRRPFHSENLMAIFYKITHEEPNFDLVPAGEEFDSILPILKKSLAKNLDERFQTAYDFAIVLRDWLKAHTTSASGQHALEDLLDLEAPTSPPQPMTDAQGATLVPAEDGELPNATMDLGSSAGRRRASTAVGRQTGTRLGTAVPTRTGASSTVVTPDTRLGTAPGTGMGATMRPGTTRLGQASSPTVVRPYTPAARPAPAPSGSPMLYVVLGVLGTALLVAVAFIYINRSASTTASPPPTVASLPPVTAPPATMAATPAPTTAPTTYVETVGRGAAAMKLAKASFDRQDYEAAISQAQQALQEDPGNTQAKRMVENALNGQKAEARLRAAQAAFGQGRLDEAMNEAEAGRNLAAWDPRFTNLMQRIRDQQQSAHREQAQAAQAAAAVQQQREQQQRMALTNQVNTLLGQADNLLASQQYDAAIKVYDEVLKVDPSNIRAGQGRTGAITARAVTQAGGGARPGGKAFVAGKTSAQSVETRAGGSVPEGFEDTAGVVVKKGSQAADLPGRILFDVDPESPKPGDKYRIRIILSNEGSAPIGIRSLTTTAVVNGRRAAGPVPALVASVAPQQRATLYEVSGEVWREDITSWSFEAVVTTSRNETYKNQITWR